MRSNELTGHLATTAGNAGRSMMMSTVTVRVYERPKDEDFEPATLLSGLREVGRGELSTDHAASSYGQPVLILDGKCYGPGDVPRYDLVVHVAESSDLNTDEWEARQQALDPDGLISAWKTLRDEMMSVNVNVLESHTRDWYCEWYLPVIWRDVEQFLPGVPMGYDEAEREELRDTPDMLRIVCRVDAEPDNDGNWDSTPYYYVEICESRPAQRGDWAARWEQLHPVIDAVTNWTNHEAMLRQNNRERQHTAYVLSAALKTIFQQRAGADTVAAIDTYIQESDEWNEEQATEDDD